MLIPDDILLMARGQQLTRLVDVCNIQSLVSTTTDTGGSAESWVDRLANIPLGVVGGPAGQDQYQHLFDDRIGQSSGFWLLFPALTDIRLTDRVVRLTPISQTYEILVIPNANESFETMRRAVGVIVG